MKSMEQIRVEYMTPKNGKTAVIGGGEAKEIILNEKYYGPLSPLEKLTDKIKKPKEK